MNPNFLSSYERLRMPEALALEHETLRAELIRWTREPGKIGKAAERVGRLCEAHFAQEEENVFRAFGMLHDIASDRARPDAAAVAKVVAQFGSLHDAMHGQHHAINAAIENMLQQSRKEAIREIAELASMLRAHEQIEDEVVYPTVLEIAGSVQAGIRI
jgi:hemerythrin superfamily protein